MLRIRLCVSDLEEVSLGTKNEKAVLKKSCLHFLTIYNNIMLPIPQRLFIIIHQTAMCVSLQLISFAHIVYP